MQTEKFGKPLWFSMFIIAANYPVKIDKTNKFHMAKRRYNKIFFTNIANVLPCRFCRRSYSVFLKELPINKYLGSRQLLMYWLYKIKNKVNNKLNKQIKSQGLDKPLKEIVPFKNICKYYETFRANCSEKTKTCSKPSIKPSITQV